MNIDPGILSEAIVLWTGWGSSARPVRDEARVTDALGEELALEFLPAVRRAEREFYESDARYTVEDLAQMGDVAADRFRSARPEIRDDAVRALAWCYTYDFR